MTMPATTTRPRPWCGQPPRIPPDAYRRMLEVRRQRQLAREHLAEYRRLVATLPTDTELAAELGVSQQTVTNAMNRGIKRYDHTTQREETP